MYFMWPRVLQFKPMLNNLEELSKNVSPFILFAALMRLKSFCLALQLTCLV